MNNPLEPDSVSLKELEEKADCLLDALDIYDRFVENKLYEDKELPSEVRGYISEILDFEEVSSSDADNGLAAGIKLAVEIEEMYKEMSGDIDEYIQCHTDAQEAVDDTKRARNATSRAHHYGGSTANYVGRSQELHKEVPDEMSVKSQIQGDSPDIGFGFSK